MRIRIFKIKGSGEKLRERRLKRLRGWMERRGWWLVDYSPEAGSAIFERAEGAPALGWFDPTRWLPGPGWFQPGLWLAWPRRTPRRVGLAAAVGLAVAGAFGTLLSFSVIGTAKREPAAAQNPAESWLYVNADSLNVRAEPKPGAQIVGVLYQNQRVMVEKSEAGWARLVRPQWGYVAARYLGEHPLR